MHPPPPRLVIYPNEKPRFLAKKAVRIAEYGVYLPASVDTSSSPIYVDEATGQYRSDTAFMDGVRISRGDFGRLRGTPALLHPSHTRTHDLDGPDF